MFGKRSQSIFKKNDRNEESNWEDDTLIDQNKYAKSKTKSGPQGSVTSSLVKKLNSLNIEEDRIKRMEEALNCSDSVPDSRISALSKKREQVITSTLQKTSIAKFSCNE
ncbi:4329_t:CDS:2 [Gigaspora margarita]|uniref:4329_t:CDS:1 n=1 Tax=Gigaspora margarita TaxID=4874 RepID=A0ABN7V940_GIGMA|nr:4329_t:CDS:2 [Gigaspora margarita]